MEKAIAVPQYVLERLLETAAGAHEEESESYPGGAHTPKRPNSRCADCAHIAAVRALLPREEA